MIYRYMREELVKLAYYDVPEQDVFSVGSSQYKKERDIEKTLGPVMNKAVIPTASGLAAAVVASKASKPFGPSPLRLAAILGTGLYTGAKVRKIKGENDGRAD
jgi:hypothetical protein